MSAKYTSNEWNTSYRIIDEHDSEPCGSRLVTDTAIIVGLSGGVDSAVAAATRTYELSAVDSPCFLSTMGYCAPDGGSQVERDFVAATGAKPPHVVDAARPAS